MNGYGLRLPEDRRFVSVPEQIKDVYGPDWEELSESSFRSWYGEHARRWGLNPDPDAPEHHYDYRAAYYAGAGPDVSGHWPSEFKAPTHPRRFIEGIDTITGLPADEWEEVPVEEYKEPFAPELFPEQGGILAEAAREATRAFIHGTLGLEEFVGTVMQYAGERLGMESLADLGETTSHFWRNLAEDFGPPEKLKGRKLWDDPSLLKDVSYWAYNVFDMIPALAASIGAILTGTAALGGVLGVAGTAARLAPATIARLIKIGGHITGGLVGGGIEGAQTYQTVLEQGGSEKEAARAAEGMTVLAGALNAFSNINILKKAGNSFLARLGKHMSTSAIEGITEGLEEPAEVVSKYLAKYIVGEEIPPKIQEDLVASLKDGFTVAPVAAVTGGGASMLAGEREAPEGAPPPPSEEVIDLVDIVEPEEKRVINAIKAEARKRNLSAQQVRTLRNVFATKYPASNENIKALDDLIQELTPPVELTEVVSPLTKSAEDSAMVFEAQARREEELRRSEGGGLLLRQQLELEEERAREREERPRVPAVEELEAVEPLEPEEAYELEEWEEITEEEIPPAEIIEEEEPPTAVPPRKPTLEEEVEEITEEELDELLEEEAEEAKEREKTKPAKEPWKKDVALEPRQYQEKYPEKTVHEDWDKANSPRFMFESAGDILREFQKENPDPGYINEKLWRVSELIEGELAKTIHPDDSWEAAVNHEPEKLNRLASQYKLQPTEGEAQETAKKLILSILRGDFRAAKDLHDLISGNVKQWSAKPSKKELIGAPSEEKPEVKGKVPPEEIPASLEEVLPKPTIEGFMKYADLYQTFVALPDGSVTDGRWVVKSGFIPKAILKRKFTGQKITQEQVDGVWKEAHANNPSPVVFARMESPQEGMEAGAAVFRNAQGKEVYLNPDYVSYLNKHIPHFNMEVGQGAEEQPVIIKSGGKEAGLLMPIRPVEKPKAKPVPGGREVTPVPKKPEPKEPEKPSADLGTPGNINSIALSDKFLDLIRGGEKGLNKVKLQSLVAEWFGISRKELTDNPKFTHKPIEEAFEYALVKRAREIINEGGSREKIYNKLKQLYLDQPPLATRTSTSIEEQGYSTPVHLAYLMQEFTGITGDTTVYEPTAGTGMLLSATDPANVHVNEIDEGRLEILRDQGFRRVTNVNAREKAPGPKSHDVVIANPPFGTIKTEKIEGFHISKLEHAIMIPALSAMKDNGKAAFIIGQHNFKPDGTMLHNQKVFLNWLYRKYNVVANIDIPGQEYARQGTKFPVRLIVVYGRKATYEGYAPTKPEAYQKVDSIDDILPILEEVERGKQGPVAAPGAPPVGGRPEGLRPPGRPEGEGRPERVPPVPRREGERPPGERGEAGLRPERPAPEEVGAPGREEEPGRAPGAPEERPGVERPGELLPGVPEEAGEPGRPEEYPGPGRPGRPGEREGVRPGAERPVTEGVPRAHDLEAEVQGMTEDEIDSVITEVANEMEGEEITPPSPPKLPETAPELVETPQKVPTKENAPEQTKPADYLKSAGIEAVEGVKNALKGLDELFGDKNILRSGITFDEESYAKAKPYFEEAWQHAKAAGYNLKQFVKFMYERYGTRIQPYLKRFVLEQQRRPEGEEAAPELQVPYTPKSKGPVVDKTLTPRNMDEATTAVLSALESRVGDIDQYVTEKLGYKNKEQLYKGLSADQIDAVALAIDNIDRGTGTICGDQTGVGKGRIAAAIMRYGQLSGLKPIFFTEKPNLFTDFYRDIVDIGHSINPFIMGSNKELSTILDQDGKPAFLPPSDKERARALHSFITHGTAGLGDHDCVITTYSQIRKPGNLPQLALAALAPGNLIILDESHNASGESNTGRYIRDILQGTHGVLYLSATFAKRPDTMPVYYKTSMSNANMSMDQLITAIERGDTPLQEHVSSALTRLGQYVRREKSFKGISMFTRVDTVNKQRDEARSDQATEILRDIVRFDEMKNAAISSINDDIQDGTIEDVFGIDIPGATISGDQTVTASVTTSNFASTVHNAVSQLLLSMKTSTAIENAIAELKAGHKPIIAVRNTMGSFVENQIEEGMLTVGDPMDMTFAQVLERHLRRTLRFKIENPDGSTTFATIPIDELPEKLQNFYHRIVEKINKFGEELPGSPIDRMKAGLLKAGYTVDELTNREYVADLTDPDTPILRHRTAQERASRNQIINAFNNGTIDALIINQAGSAGLSIHAAPQFKDKRQRVYLGVQPELNIDTEVQKMGRINRKGQVVLPQFITLQLDIPAEIRPAAVLMRKMRSLSANTSANAESILARQELPDMLNRYGNRVARDWFQDREEIQHLLRIKLDDADLMHKASGRIAIQPVGLQREFFEECEEEYELLIEDLKQEGAYELEVEELDFKAIQEEKTLLTAGNDESNPFGQSTHREKLSVISPRKPYKRDRIKALVDKRLEGKSPRQVTADLIEEITRLTNEYIEQKRAAAEEKEQEYDESTTASALYGRQRQLEDLQIGDTYTLYNNEGMRMTGVLIDIKYRHGAGNPAAASKTRLVFAVNNSYQRYSLPLSRFGIHGYVGERIVFVDHAQQGIPGDWNELLSMDVRESRYMITGNLLQGYADAPSQSRIIRFTMDDGSAREGILLPRNYDPGEHNNVRLTANQASQIALAGYPLIGDTVEIHGYMTDTQETYPIVVPKARATGGVFYLDQQLRDLTETGDFESKDNKMRAIVPRANIERAIRRIYELGDAFSVGRSTFENVIGSATSVREATVEYEQEQLRKEITDDIPNFSKGVSTTTGKIPKSPDGISTLGIGISANLREKGKIDLTGHTVKTAEDLAVLAQVYRDPRFETFRIFYTQGNTIVGHEGITSRMPGTVIIFTERPQYQMYKIRDRMKRLNADGFYMLHNHPSGAPAPSYDDAKITKLFADEVQGFKGHVVIDSGMYATMELEVDRESGLTKIVSELHRLPDLPLDWQDPLLTASLPHKELGKELRTADDVAQLGQMLKTPENYVVLFYRSANSKVRAIQEVPVKLMENIKSAGDYIRGRMRVFGAGEVLAFSNNADVFNALHRGITAPVPELIRQNVLLDFVYRAPSRIPGLVEMPTSVRELLQISRPKDMIAGRTLQQLQRTMEKVAEPETPYRPGSPLEEQREWAERYINNIIKQGEPAKTKRIKAEQEYFEKQYPDDAKETTKSVLDAWKRGKQKRELWAEERPDSTVLERLIASPEFYFEKVPAAWKVFQAGLERADNFSLYFKNITETQELSLLGIIKQFKKDRSREYKRLADLITSADRNKEAYIPDDLYKKGFSDQAVHAWQAYRQIMDNGFDALFAEMREIIEKHEAAGIPLPEVVTTVGDKKIRVDLRMALAKMGDMRGYYAPRRRKAGRYMLIAQKSGANPILEFYDLKRTRFAPINRRAKELQKQGYGIVLKKAAGMPEDVFQLAGKTVGLQAMINTALDRIYKPKAVTLDDFGLTGELREDGKDYLIRGPFSKNMSKVFKALGGKWYSYPAGDRKAWHFTDPPKDIEKRIIKGLGGIEETVLDTEMLFAHALATEVANIVKARGFRASMIKRGTEIGEEVWLGYEEDPLKAATEYASGIAAGLAKKQMASQMVKAITGTDIPFSEFGGDHAQYVAEVKRKRIDPATQPNIFRDTTTYMEEMLRNEEFADRITGFMKGITVLKYLGGRLSAPLVNLTALITSVPAAMNGYAKIPIHRTYPLLAKAMDSYLVYRFGDRSELDPDLVRLFDHIKAKGWGTAQYNREALSVLKSKFGNAWNTMIDYGMLLFGASEHLNRVSTITAAYMGLKERKAKMTREDMMTLAKKVSDRSHGIYGKVSLPHYAQGQNIAAYVGKAFYIFSKFSHTYLQTMYDLGFKQNNKRALLYMMSAPAILSGIAAAPVVTEVVTLALKHLFDVDDPEEELYAWLETNIGELGSDLARFGLFGLGGYGISLKGSLRIDITGNFPKSLPEVFGAPGNMITDVYYGGKDIIKGRVWRGIEKISPRVIGQPMQALREAREGVTTRLGVPKFLGKERMEPEMTDTILKFLTFNPAHIAKQKEQKWSETKVIRKYQQKRSDIYSRIRSYYFQPAQNRSQAEWLDILLEIKKYNERVGEKDLARVQGISPITDQSILTALRQTR